jgi:hypothetical protein
VRFSFGAAVLVGPAANLPLTGAALPCICTTPGLRKEPLAALQAVAAEALAELMVGCVPRQPCPNDKLLRNLCSMACCDPVDTPSAAAAEEEGAG